MLELTQEEEDAITSSERWRMANHMGQIAMIEDARFKKNLIAVLMYFQVGELVHSSIYKFGTVIKKRGYKITVQWEQSETLPGKNNFSDYYDDGTSRPGGYRMIQKVENRDDFYQPKDKHDPKPKGALADWQITVMDNYFKIPKKEVT